MTNKFVYILHKYVRKKAYSGVLKVEFFKSDKAKAWLSETVQQLRPVASVQSERKSKIPQLILYA